MTLKSASSGWVKVIEIYTDEFLSVISPFIVPEAVSWGMDEIYSLIGLPSLYFATALAFNAHDGGVFLGQSP